MSGDEADVACQEKPSDESVVKDPDTIEKVVNPELQIKHPLQHRWALWYFKSDRTKDWAENLKIVAKFQYVEDFWA